MRIRGRLKDFDFDFVEGVHFITLVIDDANLEEVNKLRNRTLSIDIKEQEKAKTPSQNRFFWEIVTQISNALNTTKDEVYKHLLSHYGTPIAELKANKITDVSNMDVHYILQKPGRKYNYYLVIKGISLMTSKEMTSFIEHTLSEAAELGIDTTPPQEWERLKNLWSNR